MAAAFVSLLDKLKSPHRSVQRHAVRAIFESLRSYSSQGTSGHSHLLLHSPAGKQALSDCLLLSSRTAPALDEAISQLCYLAIGQKSPSSAYDDDDGEPLVALFHLQALLECSPPEAVPSIVRCIAFVCRFLLAKRWSVLQGLLSHELHPLIKAFESRPESHLEIIQQVIIMLTQNDLTKKDTEFLHFLKPLLNYLAVNSTLSNERYLVIRELCFNIASLVSSNFATGRFLMRLLLCFNSQQTEDAERMATGLREMVDAAESWVRQACSKEEIGDCKGVLVDILSLLVDSCLSLNKSGISPLPILQLLGRIVRLQKHSDDSFAWRRNVLSLAYLLALTDVTEEQLTLICLARDVLRKTNEKGVDLLIYSIDIFPFALLWIYPTVNIMASSYSPLKEEATNLLHDLEDLLVLYWTQNESSTSPQTQDCYSLHSHGQLADNIHRILLHIWFNDKPWETWISLKDDLGWIDVNNRQSKSWLHSLSRFFGEIFQNYSNAQKSKRKSGVISWICMMISAVLIHPVMTIVASEVFAEIVKTDRTEGVSLLPVLLFYLRAWKRNQRELNASNVFGLLKVLPILAVDQMSSSIVVGTLQSLLSSECSGVLQSTAIRLLCKTWEMSDKVFPHLQTALGHSYFSEDSTDIQMHLSRAASICDICKKDGDSGVELILSVQACTESEHISIKALGLQSLSWLCHHDVIEFYTAWDFLSDLFPELPCDPLLAESIVWFFQNGALDAAAYPEACQTILQLLWEATQIQDVGRTAVRESALKALCQYEVDLLDASLGDHRASYVKILLSEKEPEVIRASQSLIIKFLHHENKFRYRDQNKKKHVDTKTEKILYAIPRVLFTADDRQGLLIHSPPAYLLLKFDESLSPLDFQSKMKLQAWESEFEREFSEIADQLNCQSNLIYALLYLDSWIPFIKYHISRRRGLNTMSDIASNVRDTPFHLMKILCRISEQAIPRVAENAVLVLGILYQVSHTIPDSLVVPIVSYLKGHLMQQSHEYLQWTSAISLGIIARNCSGSEWRLKIEISNCLLQCLSSSDRDLVRGACGIGLGFVDQNIMSQEDLHVSGTLDSEGTVKEKELMIHYQIVKNILNMFSVWFPNLFLKWEKLVLPVAVECSGYGEGLYFPEIKSFSSEDNECIWTASGLCIALACTVVSWERIGDLNSVGHIVEVMIDGIHAIIREDDEECSRLFAVGAFLSLPTFVEPCLRLEISTEKVEGVFEDVKQFIKVFLQNNNIPDELKMAACIGSGNFIATLLHDGTFKLCLEDINLVIAAMKGISVEKNCGLATLGAFIGLSNILHGGAGRVSPLRRRRMDIFKHLSEAMEDAKSTVCIPLLYSNSCKVIVQELLQHLLNAFLQEEKPSLKSCAGWALALIRKISTGKKDLEHDDSPDTNHMKPYKLMLGSLPKDSTLYILTSLLLDIRNTHVNTAYPYATAISILRCLKEAPQLPYLDWGTVMRQMLQQMKALGSVDKENAHIMQDDLCKECILFALAHARKLSNLHIFLDEICDLSRLISVQKTVSSVLMLHIADLSSIFSWHRLEKFFNDSASFICRHRNIDPGLNEDSEINFWKGFKGLLTRIDKEGSEINLNSLFIASEKCIELLDSPLNSGNTKLASMKWTEALECMSLASTAWIVKVAQFDWKERPVTKKDEISAVKAVYILSQLVARCRLTPPTVWKPLRWLCQQESSSDTFKQLLWVTLSLDKMPQKEREGFLIEAIETTCSFTDPELGLLFIALLSSSWCSFAPVIILDSQKILELMPFTLPLLLSEESWRFSAKPILWKLVVLLDKFPGGSRKPGSGLYYIKGVCIAMSKDLPLVDRLKLCECF